MEIENLNTDQLIELTKQTEDKDALREIATHVGVSFSGNTGLQKLKENVLSTLNLKKDIEEKEAQGDDQDTDPDLDKNDPVAQALLAQNKARAEDDDVHVKHKTINYSIAEMMEMDAAQVKDPELRKKVIRTQALRLRRVRIVNNDPADAAVPGAIITVVTKYTGKVSKYISFEEEFYENGYHVPQIILDDLNSRTYNVRREKKSKGNQVGVKEYRTVRQRKFMIEYLPDLTAAQLEALGKEQTARGAIDRSNTI